MPPPPNVANTTGALAANNGYLYQPLKYEKHEIRLVQIGPALDAEQTINCHLLHVSLDEDHIPGYHALSYTWGSSVQSDGILLDGQFVQVGENLGSALRRLRSKVDGESILIWIDAICINQDDNDEKSEQISQMRRIFQQAEAISIWIGPDSIESQSAFKLVRDLGGCAPDGLSALIRDPARAEQLEALRRLFYRDYWWRIWVIQEVVVAANATVYCGADSISWADLYAIGDKLTLVRDDIRHVYHDKPDSIYKLLSSGPRALKIPRLSDNEQPRLMDLLRSHRSKYSTDPRDKVFGLIGISDARDSFRIDYSWSTREVYTYTAKHIIRSSGSLDVICVAKNNDNTYNLPSWVPDWTRNDAHTKHRVMGLHIRAPPFSAAGKTLAIANFLEDGFVLRASGFQIGTIEHVGPALDLNQIQEKPYVSTAMQKLRATCQAFLQWWNIFSSFRGQSIIAQDVFERTVFGGSWSAASEFNQEHRLQLFFSLCKTLLPEATINVPQRTLRQDIDNAKNQEAMVSAASLRMHGKRLIMCTSNLAGLAPWDTEKGDVLCILLGCSFPVALRPDNGRYKLIGEVYVDEFMKGEAIAALDAGKYVLDTFELQ